MQKDTVYHKRQKFNHTAVNKIVFCSLFYSLLLFIQGCQPCTCPDPVIPINPCSPDPVYGYAFQLQSPIAGSNSPTFLKKAFSSFPIRVLIQNSPYWTQAAQQDAIAGFEKWVTATNNAIKFTYTNSYNYTGEEIVVTFVIRSQISGGQGYTLPVQNYTSIQIAVDNPNAPPYYFQTQAQLQRVSCHEMGHALGIYAHSACTNDIMSVGEVATGPSTADVNTLRYAYGGIFP